MSIFNDSKYTRWYNQIVTTAKQQNVLGVGFLEKHHIIPKAMGGNDKAENIVNLTVRQHFVCHWLLTKMVSGVNVRKAWRGLRAMALMDASQEKHRLAGVRMTSRMFEQLRIVNFAPDTDETRAKKRQSAIGRLHSSETRAKMKATRLERYGSKRTKIIRTEPKWAVWAPNGALHEIENLTTFCAERKLDQPSLMLTLKSGAPLPPRQRNRTQKISQLRDNTVGWQIVEKRGRKITIQCNDRRRPGTPSLGSVELNKKGIRRSPG